LMVLPEDSDAGGMIIRGNCITAGLRPIIFKNEPKPQRLRGFILLFSK